ncbi:MAG: hypothetical protein LBL83_04275 [Clostridiales bacterium]|nr:hypothetical protein [Clostridiales bacterium]
MASVTKGNCYLCGGQFGKTAMKNHLIKAHADYDGQGGPQKCFLLKIEGAHAKGYWLYVDVPVTAALSSVDSFLRKIWLECCGHMSAFSIPGGLNEIGKSRKLGDIFPYQDKLMHEYDFGTPTDTLITVVGETTRKTQKASVRLLARNVPPAFLCSSCGEPATVICAECVYDSDNPFFCDACGESHEHCDTLLPVTNSPRIGDCGYDGAMDVYEFYPQMLSGKR